MEELRQLVHQAVEVCMGIKEGENVWIHSWDHTTDLAFDIAFACRQSGAQPFVTLLTEDYWMRSLVETPRELLETLPSHQAAALEHTDAFIFMLGPKSPIDWDRIPPEKRGLANVWYSDSNKYLDSWRKIAQENSIRMLGIEYCLATEEWSQAWGLDHARWRRVMLAGCLTDQREIAKKAAELARIIRDSHEVSVRTPSGTNLRFELAGRRPIIGDSIVSEKDAAEGTVKFLPSGFVEAAADEDSADGKVVYDSPILVRGAKRIEGLTLKFKHGKLAKYSARVGVEAFRKYLDSAGGDVDKFGFFGIGLNPGLKHGFTQDDKVLGGFTLGIGGNEDKGGRNQTTGNRHWWASMTRATVQIDDKLVLEHGLETF
ncbi:MAG: aminopeptidase [Candidatus Bathyarchaeia archaeon]